MKHAAIKKLKNKKGSSLIEALAGFAIAVISVLLLVNAVQATYRIVESGNTALDWLFREEEAAEYYMAGLEKDPEGNKFDTSGGTDLGIEYEGSLEIVSGHGGGGTIENVNYYVTNHDNSHRSTSHLVAFRLDD